MCRNWKYLMTEEIMTDKDREPIREASNLRCGQASKLEIYKDLEFELEKLLDFRETRTKENETIQYIDTI